MKSKISTTTIRSQKIVTKCFLWTRHFTDINIKKKFSQPHFEVDTLIPTLLIRKLRHRLKVLQLVSDGAGVQPKLSASKALCS